MAKAQTIPGRMRSVYIGRRLVGELSEDEWLFIVDEVHANRRIWIAQAKNALRCLARALGFGFIGVPLGVFWTAVLLKWLGKPIAFPGPGEHIGTLLGHPEMLLGGIALAVGAMSAIGIRLGYVNYFARARSAFLKERLEIDEPGQCDVR